MSIMVRLLFVLGMSLASAAPPSSSRPTTVSSKASIVRPQGCPPVTIQTQTSTRYRYTSVLGPVETETETPKQYTDKTLRPLTYTYTETTYKTTVTATTTYSYYTIASFLPYSTTVTVAAPTGFTPVLCQSDYFDPTTTVTSFSTLTEPVSTTTTTLSSTSTVTFFQGDTIIKTRTVTKSLTTYFQGEYPTFTTTINQPTRTKYLACASKNIAMQVPNGQNISAVVPAGYTNPDANQTTVQVSIYARNAVDCCEQCQAQANCAGSAFIETSVQTGNANCVLFDIDRGVCGQKSSRGELVVGGFQEGATVFVSNGRCGTAQFGSLF